MLDVFIILPFFFGMLIISYIINRIIPLHKTGPFTVIYNSLRFIGVAIHELAHYSIAFLVGAEPYDYTVNLKSGGKVNPHGHIKVRDDARLTFMQSFLISFAPLIVGTWFFLFFLNIIFLEGIEFIYQLIAGFFCTSIILGCTPSKVDVKAVGYAFSRDRNYSLYQIFLTILSGFLVWIIIITYEIMLFIDLLYYIFVAFGYFILKYFFRGLASLKYLKHTRLEDNYYELDRKMLRRKRIKRRKQYKRPMGGY
ncbi:MAG: hypothetical protein ACTSR8_14070 [Promethearchaeota archaeon]